MSTSLDSNIFATYSIPLEEVEQWTLEGLLHDTNLRIYNCLRRAQIDTMGQLLSKTQEDLLRVNGLGVGGISHIQSYLSKYGLFLAGTPQDLPSIIQVSQHDYHQRKEFYPDRNSTIKDLWEHDYITARVHRVLKRIHVDTLGDLLKYIEADLLNIRDLGITSVYRIQEFLERYGYSLAYDPKEISGESV